MGGVFEVIQSLSDSFRRRVFEGTGGWSEKSPGGSKSLTLFGKDTLLFNAPQPKENDSRDDVRKTIYCSDCATDKLQNVDRLSNASQLASR